MFPLTFVAILLQGDRVGMNIEYKIVTTYWLVLGLALLYVAIIPFI